MSNDAIEAVYRVRSPAARIGARSEALLLEQTVELPRSIIRNPFVRERLIGRVVSADAVGDGDFRVTLSQPALAAADDPAQLLNVLFGNCSLQADVELEDVRLPDALALSLGGPRHGIAGLRSLTGVMARALTASVLKPVGLSVTDMAGLCNTLALGGLDIITDDHGMADPPFCPFVDRVRACLGAADDAAQTTGRLTVYAPNLIGSPASVRRHAHEARDLGVQAVMASPMLIGLPFFNEIVREIDLPVIAHPAFVGVGRIAPPALLGKLFPLFGADAVIFPNDGGRFSYGADVCSAIARALREPEARIAPAMPAPAGGIEIQNLPAVLETYGTDSMLLVGGSLLEAPNAAALLVRARKFAVTVRDFFKLA
jgi:ribulose-bisphosphate carboxylase large chain